MAQGAVGKWRHNGSTIYVYRIKGQNETPAEAASAFKGQCVALTGLDDSSNTDTPEPTEPANDYGPLRLVTSWIDSELLIEVSVETATVDGTTVHEALVAAVLSEMPGA